MEESTRNYIECIGESLIREYLSKKMQYASKNAKSLLFCMKSGIQVVQGFEATLRCLSLEYPKRKMQVYNLEELSEQLGVQNLLNIQENYFYPHSSVLEVLLQEFIKNNNKQTNTHLNFNSINYNLTQNSAMKNVHFNIIQKEIEINNLEMSMKGSMFNETASNCNKFSRTHKTPHTYLPASGRNKLQKFQPGFEAIKYFLNSVSKGCSKFVDKKEDSESLTDYPYGYHHSSLHESVDYTNSNPRSYPKRHLQKALREREDALISSIKNSSDYKHNDNRIRLGPSKLNTFQCLKDKQTSTENNLDVEEKKSNITPDIINRFKEENYEFLENISDCDITKSTLKSETIENKEDISKENEISNKIFITDESNLATDNICSQDNISFKETDSSNEVVQNNLFVTNAVLENSITNLQETENSKSEESSQEIVQETKSNENNTSQNGNSKYCSIHKANRSLETTKMTEERKNNVVEVTPTIKEKVKKYLNEMDVLIEEKDFSTDKFIPISSEMIILLKKLIFHSENSSVAHQWLGQSFVFSQNKHFKYGLIQNKRGPSGILATVQAFILKALLFDSDTATVCPHPFYPTTREVNVSLINALSNILWQAGQKKCGVIVRCNEKEDASNSDLFSGLECQIFTNLASLQAAIEKNINQFISSCRNGCFLFMVSVILSSGIKNVAADISDEVCSLIGQNGLCSLELVTLLLTGHAVSNVFDNSMLLDSFLFHGVSKRSDVGFLSIQEHFKTFQVGSNLKTPKYPIWIVNSENHFTVIYSNNMKLVSDWRAERQFCIHHYDSMQNSSEEVKLTIDTTGFYIKGRTEEEYIPPLELCLRTKWKDAAFSWK